MALIELLGGIVIGIFLGMFMKEIKKTIDNYYDRLQKIQEKEKDRKSK